MRSVGNPTDSLRAIPKYFAMPVIKKLTCPYCDSDYVELTPPSPIAVESGNVWYQCNYCVRMWSVPKVPLSFEDRS